MNKTESLPSNLHGLNQETDTCNNYDAVYYHMY